MHLAIHIGAHYTDEDQMVRCLLADASELLNLGIVVPNPARYRQQLRSLAQELAHRDITKDVEGGILEAIFGNLEPKRLVLSWDGFLSWPRWIVANGDLYPAAGERIGNLLRLFPSAEASIYIGVKDMATFLPTIVHRNPSSPLRDEILASNLAELRWSNVISEIGSNNPSVPITVWRDEDFPILWPEILRTVSGHPNEMTLTAWLDRYSNMLSSQAYRAIQRWFNSSSYVDERYTRRILAALLSRLAKTEAPNLGEDVFDWSNEFIDLLGAAYDIDMDLVAALPNVRLLEP